MNAWSPYTDLIGKFPLKVEIEGDALCFKCNDGIMYKFYHDQSCCESVYIDEVSGDIKSLIGGTITDVAISTEDLGSGRDEDITKTTIEVFKGDTKVTVIWMGSSNGYYSTSVDFGTEAWPLDEYRDYKIGQVIDPEVN